VITDPASHSILLATTRIDPCRWWSSAPTWLWSMSVTSRCSILQVASGSIPITAGIIDHDRVQFRHRPLASWSLPTYPRGAGTVPAPFATPPFSNPQRGSAHDGRSLMDCGWDDVYLVRSQACRSPTYQVPHPATTTEPTRHAEQPGGSRGRRITQGHEGRDDQRHRQCCVGSEGITEAALR
jgi:hypothetical protein